MLLEPRTRAEQAEIAQDHPRGARGPPRPAPRARMLAARDRRPAPLRDDKVLTAWNGLMIAAYADGFRVLKDPRYRQAAEQAADFLLARLRDPDGGLLADLPRRTGETARLPGRLRLPRPRPPAAPRRHRRPEAPGPGPRADRPDDRRLRRREGRRLLLHRRRPREPARPPQGPLRRRPARRQQRGDPQPRGAGRRDRRAALSRPRRQGPRRLQRPRWPSTRRRFP